MQLPGSLCPQKENKTWDEQQVYLEETVKKKSMLGRAEQFTLWYKDELCYKK